MLTDKAEAVVLGNLTKDVELAETQTGKKVAHLDIAVSRGKGDWAEYFKCTAWEEIASQVEGLSKGERVEVEGSLRRTRPYQNKHGQEVRDFEIVAKDVRKIV